MTKYDEEFKKQAVEKYLDGQSAASIAREIGLMRTRFTLIGKVNTLPQNTVACFIFTAIGNQ